MHRYFIAALACALVAASAFGARDASAKRSPMVASASVTNGTVINLQSISDSSLQQVVPGLWGKTLSGNSQAAAALIEISSVRAHRHNETAEFIYVLSGSARVTMGSRSAAVSAGDFVYLPKGIPHSVQATDGKVKVLAVEVPPMIAGDMHYMSTSMDSSMNAGASGMAGSVTHVQGISDNSLQRLIPGVWSKTLANNTRAAASLTEFSTVRPHWHNRVSHFYYVLDGSAQLTVGHRTTNVGAGDFVYITKGVTHSIR